MLSRVRRAVIDTTQRRQVPWDHSSLTGDFYFQPAALEAADTEPGPAATEAPSPSGSDVVVWSVIQGSANATDFEIFLEKYPQSPFAAFAQGRLAALTPQPGSSGPSAPPEARTDAPQGASDGQQPIDAGADQVAATERKAVSGPPEPRGEETAAEEPADAALAALSEQSPSSGPESEAAPVDTPIVPPSEPEQRHVAAVTGETPSEAAAPLPGSVAQARAVEQGLGLSRDDWREVLRALHRLNHAAGPEDGLPGPQTRGALEAWQRAVGSAPTGHLTAAQHARLLEEAAPEMAAVTPGPIPAAEAAPEVAAVAPGPIPAAEGELIDECDRLAGQPSDPRHVGAGVEWRHLQPEPALVACALAMQEHSDEVRFQYQYGRALLRVGLIDDARLWFRSTAEQGYVAAQRNVGHMYMLGVGVPRDEGEAASWYRRAAEQSDSRSQYLLGLMYAVGLGVSRDDAQAATWLRRAAEQEEEGAQFILGWMYKHGRGVPRDLAQAAAWYSEAAAQGNQVASTALQRLP